MFHWNLNFWTHPASHFILCLMISSPLHKLIMRTLSLSSLPPSTPPPLWRWYQDREDVIISQSESRIVTQWPMRGPEMTGDRSTGVAPLSADQMTKHRLNAVCYIKSASGKTFIIRRGELQLRNCLLVWNVERGPPQGAAWPRPRRQHNMPGIVKIPIYHKLMVQTS